MTSGDELGDVARSDLDSLLSAALRIAGQALEQASAFEPFVLVVGADGRLLAAEIDRSQLGKHPESEELAEAATAQLVGLAASVRATALALTTRLARQRSDAIEVRLDHRDGGSLVVIVQFRRPRFGGSVEYEAASTFRGSATIWPA